MAKGCYPGLLSPSHIWPALRPGGQQDFLQLGVGGGGGSAQGWLEHTKRSKRLGCGAESTRHGENAAGGVRDEHGDAATQARSILSQPSSSTQFASLRQRREKRGVRSAPIST